MTGSRQPLAIAAAASLVLLVVSVWSMAQRVDEYYRETDRRDYLFHPVDTREFIFSERPVKVADATTPGHGAGDQTVIITYGDAELRLPATIAPGSPQLPDLKRHLDWLQVFRFAERGRVYVKEFDRQIKTGQIREHLVAIVRTPPAGSDHPAPGEILREEWAFDFYEFNPQGGFDHERLSFPRARKEPKPGQLVEGTWEFKAALLMMPKLGAPSPRFTGDALPAMGWTLPAAGVSGLVLTLSAALLLAPKRRAPAEPCPA